MSKQDNNTEKETALDKTDQGGNSLTRRETDVGFSLQPKNLQEAMKVCEYLAGSSMVPKQYQGNPADILVAINFGQEVGLKPLQSLNSVAVVNGTPSLWGDAPLAMVKQHPEFEFILEDNEAFAYARDEVKGWGHLKDVDKDDTSICVVKREGEPPTVREFSKEDVSKAKLGNVHNTYPKIMRRYRARSQALKAAFPDVLKGFEQAEIQKETQKMIDEGHYEDYTDVTQYSQQDQPKAEEREDVDIDNGLSAEKERMKEQAENMSLTQKKLYVDNAFNSDDWDDDPAIDFMVDEIKKADPDYQCPWEREYDSPKGTKEADQSADQDEQVLLTEVNELGKEIYGTKWYTESKAYVHNYDEDADNLTEVGIDGLKHIKRQLEAKAKAEA